MKQHKKLTSTTLLLAVAINLIPLFALADSSAEINNYISDNSSASVSSQCDVQDAPSIFVLEALFANPENPYPVELWENRDNEQINIFDIAREIKSIANLKEKIFNNTDEAKRTRLFERLSQMEDIADRALIMEADKWKPNYVSELMKHIIGIRHTGISDLIPAILDPANCKDEDKDKDYVANPCDENGTPWTSFSSLCNFSEESPSIANYMQQHGADIKFISSWWGDQVGNSWNDGCRAVKLFYSNQRTLDPQTYYWGKDGHKVAEDEYSTFWKQGSDDNEDMCYLKGTHKEEDRIKAFTIWHAYVQEVLTKSKFHHNDQINKQVCLTRTNGLNSLSRNNITDAGKGYTMPSAVYDSYTLTKIYMKESPTNRAILESSVPHHRVIHLYPLIQINWGKGVKKKLEEEKQELTNFIVNNFYDNSGSLTLDLSSSSAINEAFEKLVYNQKKQSLETPLENSYSTIDFSHSNHDYYCLKMVSALPERLTADNLTLLLNSFFNECLSDGNHSETEFVVLSGPDLPFDYFYQTTDALSHYEKRLDSGESVCGFWPNLEDLKQIGHLGGGTGAALYQDSKTGKKYVLKRGASESHIREEFLADQFYQIAGFAVPECRLYGTPEGPVKVVSYLEDSQPLYTAYYNANETEKQRLRNEIAKGFMLDALLANFDIIGLDMDNILVKNDGQVYRVDSGASFRYRATGKLKKPEGWNPSPMTLWSLRDPKRNPNGAEIFSHVNIYEVAENIMDYYEAQTMNGINARTSRYWELERLVENNIPELQSQMKIRKENFNKVAIKALQMKIQGLSPQEADIKLREWAEAEDWGPAFE